MTCQHRYRLDSPNDQQGLRSRGVCSKCGLERMFPNTFEETLKDKRGVWGTQALHPVEPVTVIGKHGLGAK